MVVLTLKKRLPFHYAWVILIACCMMMGSTLGTMVNCRGIFISPVCKGLGCSTSEIALYVTLYGIFSMVALIKVPKIFESYNINRVLTTALVFFVLSSAIMGLATDLTFIYIGGALQGLSGAFILFVPTPMLIKSWFNSRRGLALGIASTSSGVFGALMSPILNEIIMRWGWRVGYFAQSAIVFAIAAPATLFLIVKEPKDIGLEPYGEKIIEPVSSPKEESGSYMSLGMILCIIYMPVVSVITCYAQFLSNHAVTIGLDSRVGAAMLSCAMIGNTGGKALFGAMCDKYGAKNIATLSAVTTSTGLMLVAFCRTPILCCLGALLFGACYFNQIVVPPLLVADIVPKNAYNKAYPKVTMSQMIVVAVTPTIVSAIYDVTNSYRPIFVFTLLFEAFSIVLNIVIAKIIEKRKAMI